MHYALEQTQIPYTVIAAFDINANANAVYHHNFPHTPIVQKGIEHLPLAYFEHLQADLYTMSPPCQPYTRMGRQLQSQDNRSKSFLYLLDVLRDMKCKPRWLLVENVKGFDGSDTRRLMVDRLQECGYGICEYLLSPTQFGVPNSRLRYYLLAELIQYNGSSRVIFDANIYSQPVKSLNDYLLNEDGDYQRFLLSDKILWRYGGIIDIVNSGSQQSCCFTKNYFRMMESSGSVLHTNLDCTIDEAFAEYFKCRELPDITTQRPCPLQRLKMRFCK
jgi:tRNA (cytosine38-C5)-methyltransferase